MIVNTRNPDTIRVVPGPTRGAELLDILDLPARTVPVIEEPRHRAAWCARHVVDHVHNQVRKAIDHGYGLEHGERMFTYDDRLLVAVSGGKDSLALWDALLTMGYRVDGLYVGLAIGGYSTRSRDTCRAFADRRGAQLRIVDLAEAYDVLLTGHNLDDEAATLLGNVLRRHDDFLARQRPVLPEPGGLQTRTCKPLYRLSERETAASCVVRGIDDVVEECPPVADDSGHDLKAALDLLEAGSPGVKAQLLFGFLDPHQRTPPDDGDEHSADLRACTRCGMATVTEVCTFCRQQEPILSMLPLLNAEVNA